MAGSTFNTDKLPNIQICADESAVSVWHSVSFWQALVGGAWWYDSLFFPGYLPSTFLGLFYPDPKTKREIPLEPLGDLEMSGRMFGGKKKSRVIDSWMTRDFVSTL